MFARAIVQPDSSAKVANVHRGFGSLTDMRALAVQPAKPDSAALVVVGEPPASEGSILVETIAVGVCGTDREIVAGIHGEPPDGSDALVLGHESLGRVAEAPAQSGFGRGDLVVGIVRRPDPEPCINCAAGEWDMCRNGMYTECGIKQRDGFCRERFRIEPEFLVRLDPRLGSVGVLLEPASVVAKAWEQIEYIGRRARWAPRRVLVTGAGPVGLLAALMGIQRGLAVDVLDIVEDGPKPKLVADLGGQYHTGGIDRLAASADIVIECTGVGTLVFECIRHTPRGGIVCLAGISAGKRCIEINPGKLNTRIVLENDVVFGTVNANRRHYEQAAQALQKADRSWLERMITRRVPLVQWREALQPDPHNVKAVIEFS
jgi:threonine dehydrogenase-like Zn-dependent dehydrogenase